MKARWILTLEAVILGVTSFGVKRMILAFNSWKETRFVETIITL